VGAVILVLGFALGLSGAGFLLGWRLAFRFAAFNLEQAAVGHPALRAALEQIAKDRLDDEC
jgi:hypothetical protein